MNAEPGKVSKALQSGVLLLSLVLLFSQTLAQDHLHLDPDTGSSCVICVQGDHTPLSGGIEAARGDPRPGFRAANIEPPDTPLSACQYGYAARGPPLI